ncbi:hypothetical protein GY45DRAFT_469684 [Cubamyces sp. BRFM 1775]|nr:hypothetical protein GY45DRAFT_469684 [Cubamyces sp. BRFM 1775]
MAHKAICIEVTEFLDTFFPLPEGVTADQHPQWAEDVFDGLAAGEVLTEQEIQRRFVETVNDNDLIPGLKMSTSSEKPDITEMGNFKQKPDAAIFKADSVPTDGRPHWADQLITVEFKRNTTSQDPFDDRKGAELESDAATRKEVRGQLIDYSELVFRIQHRTALFMILVINRNIRVLRWDRSGTVVTPAFDYVANPQLLCEILWRMSLLSDEQLGIDTSATRLHPSDTDYKLMDILALASETDLSSTHGHDLLPAERQRKDHIFKHVREKFQEAVDPKWPRYRVEVPDGDGVRTFLIGAPAFYAQGMACRGTKGYVAWDIQAQRFAWLKDAWRLDYERMEPEGVILRKLNAHGVINVPTLVCHGDIRNQKTRTPDIWEAQQPLRPATPASTAASVSPSPTLVDPAHQMSSTMSRKRTLVEVEDEDTSDGEEEYTLRRHAHYRIVVQEVAKPLSEFLSGKHLVSVIIDCVRAHRDAVAKANVVHRDVSSGNILILPKVVYNKNTGKPRVAWKGLLADWELSKPIHEAEPPLRPRQPPRTGTWQFLSVSMLTENPKTVEIPDELESYLHVLLYFSVRYLHSDCKDPAEFIESYFDSYTFQDGLYTCGLKKMRVIKTAGRLETRMGVPLMFYSPMDEIFRRLLPLFKAHYKVQDYLKKKDAALKLPFRNIRPMPSSAPPPSATVSLALDDDPDGVTAASLALDDDDDTDDDTAALQAFAAEQAALAIPVDDAPTPEEHARAALVQNHNFVLWSLKNVIYRRDPECRWGDDKVGDRVPHEYKPQVPLANPHGASARTMKRRRTTDIAVVPLAFSSLPKRLTQSQMPKAK